jgi:hypothetical protein
MALLLLFIFNATIILAQQTSQPPSPTPALKSRQPKQPAANGQKQSPADERGSEQSRLSSRFSQPRRPTKKPPTIKPKTLINRRPIGGWFELTGAIVFVGVLQTIVFGLRARRLKQTIDTMDDISTQQTKDVQASIAEATRVSKAMEGIAESMASNVESVRESVGISREIADMQKLATELQSRPYLSAVFDTALFQDANHVFEVQAMLQNSGNRPA